MKKKIRVGSRESSLAIAQSKWIMSEIKNKFPYLEFEIIAIKTKGDLLLDTRLDTIGGKGLFIKELECALMNNSIDIAVHSMKDMPVEIPQELVISAVSKREDPRDVLMTPGGKMLDELTSGSVIGTSSVRREVQIREIRPDLKFKTLRGNVLTRIRKLLHNEYDAIVLAAAGFKRLGLQEKGIRYFRVEDVIPAVGQGVLAVETRKYDDVDYLLESIHSEESALQVSAERAYMAKLNGGCSTPIAAYAIIEGDRMKVYGMLSTQDKTTVYKALIEGNKNNASNLGEKLADLILRQIKG